MFYEVINLKEHFWSDYVKVEWNILEFFG